MLERNPYLINKTFKSYLIATVLASMALSMGVVVDGIIVGNLLGSKALSAVNLAAPLSQLFNATYIILNVGGGMLVAMAIGKRKLEDVNRIFSLSMTLNLVVGILIMVAGVLFLDNIVKILCADPTLQPLVRNYVQVMLWTAPIYLLLPGICVYVRTDSAPKLASTALIIANVLNLILDIVFIKYLNWGIRGSSIATSVGFTVGLLIALTHFSKKERLVHFSKPASFSELAPLLLMGLPVALGSVLIMVKLLSVNHIVINELGTTGITIFAVCFNLLMISSMFVSGTVQTMQPIGGMLYGAEDYRGVNLVIKAAAKTLIVSLLLLFLSLQLFPTFFAQLFGITDPDILKAAPSAIRLFSLSIPLFGLNYLFMIIYQLSRRNNLSIVISSTQALMVIPVMLLFALFNSDAMIWLSFVVGELLVFGLIMIVSSSIRKRNSNLTPLTLIEMPQKDSVLDFSQQGSIDEIKDLMPTVHRFLEEREIPLRMKNAIEMSVEELTLNIIQHAYEDKKRHFIDIRIRILEDKAILCITDDGIPFDPIKYDSQTGIGLLIVKKMCSKIEYIRSMNQNIVTATIKQN